MNAGVYIFVILTAWGWHCGAETCCSCYMSYMVYQRGHMLDGTLMVRIT